MSIGRLETEADLERFVEGLLAQRLTSQQGQLGSAQQAVTALEAAFVPPAWTALSLTNSWVNAAGYAPLAYRVWPQGLVWLRGVIENGVSGATAATLPVGARPPFDMYPPVVGSGGAAGNYMLIAANGIVAPTRTGATIFINTAFWTD